MSTQPVMVSIVGIDQTSAAFASAQARVAAESVKGQ
jgi:hypothetical protein